MKKLLLISLAILLITSDNCFAQDYGDDIFIDGGGATSPYVINVVGTETNGSSPTVGSGTITWSGATHTTDEDSNANAAYELEGINDYVRVSGSGISQTAGTIGLKYRYTGSSTPTCLVSIGTSSDATNFRIFYHTTTALRGYYNGNIYQATVSDDVADGDWHDIVMTWSQSGTTVIFRIAVDGGTAGGETKTVSAEIDTTYIYIGNRTTANSGCNGTISDVWIKNSADTI